MTANVTEQKGFDGETEYAVMLPHGGRWLYSNKQKAKNAALVARALAAMPSRTYKTESYNPGTHTIETVEVNVSTIAKWGQQNALAKALGYYSHANIYNLIAHGHVPKGDRFERLLEIAYSIPENWYENYWPEKDAS